VGAVHAFSRDLFSPVRAQRKRREATRRCEQGYAAGTDFDLCNGQEVSTTGVALPKFNVQKYETIFGD
jgi:hypothetical protein